MSRQLRPSGVVLIVLAGVLAFGLVAPVPATARVRPIAAATASGVAPAPPVAAVGRYTLPISGPPSVLRPFQPPPTPYAAGHRGVDLAATPNQVVHSAAAGVVSFAGFVAGRGLVVVTHPDGVRTEYEPLDPTVRAGQTVAGGDPLGLVAGQHAGCRPSMCLHWGARRGETYFDPMTLLAPLGPVHLNPWMTTNG
jgi:murein DD-endopeptidase MepM/ murein hydrolase activator NlpD